MTTSTCHVCGEGFEPRFRYQVREEEGRFLYVCSIACQQRILAGERGGCACSICGAAFELELPSQVVVADGVRRYFCSPACRAQSTTQTERRAPVNVSAAPPPLAPVRKGIRRLAVFNHKGGTGKTTTSVSLAAALAESGLAVLLVDADGQGNVGSSLGVRGERTLYHVLVHGADPFDVVVPVRAGLDVITSNESLAAAELALASRASRHRALREALGAFADRYDVVVVDCAPALSLMNQNALVFADGVVVPVACDYLSLIGVRQVLKTIRGVRDHLQHDARLLGVVPTFYDVRNRIAREAFDTLTRHFGEHCLPPVRVNTRLREAPAVRRTIFEHAPDSHAAQDYRAVVARLLALAESASFAADALLEAS